MANWAALQESLVGLPVSKRAKHGIHFDKGNGEIVANFSGKPCHFLDGGIWKPIDTKLLLRPDGYYGCPHSKVKVKLDGTVAVEGTDYVQRTELPTAQTGLLDNDKLVRKFSFGEQRMWVTEDGFKSEIQLNRIPTLTEAKKLIASESGTLSAQYLKSLTVAIDANGDVHTYSTLTAFRTWLATAKFPVVIDPDFGGSNADKTIYGYYPFAGGWTTIRNSSNTTRAGDTTAKLGFDTDVTDGAPIYLYRLYFSFDTSTIDDGATVTQANLKFVCTADESTVDFDVYIGKLDWSALAQEACFDGSLTCDLDADWRSTSGISLNTQYSSANLDTAWINKTGVTYYTLLADYDRDNQTPTAQQLKYITLAMNENATAEYRPVLTVLSAAGGIPKHFMHYQRLRSL